jgi:hypothetical protein
MVLVCGQRFGLSDRGVRQGKRSERRTPDRARRAVSSAFAVGQARAEDAGNQRCACESAKRGAGVHSEHPLALGLAAADATQRMHRREICTPGSTPKKKKPLNSGSQAPRNCTPRMAPTVGKINRKRNTLVSRSNGAGRICILGDTAAGRVSTTPERMECTDVANHFAPTNDENFTFAHSTMSLAPPRRFPAALRSPNLRAPPPATVDVATLAPTARLAASLKRE